ncbi:LLM class oxidoreductase [Salinicoccus sp. HZC-1]|uniref:LLM class oxidoreductase n=1 Tax=Salinicoccus sp. HZC-1 TaxID=3385497 RepID=UPI00398B8ADB
MHKFDGHKGFQKAFGQGKMTLGLSFPLEGYEKSIPEMDMELQIKRAQLAEAQGFSALWARDIPLNDTVNFGDAGQMYDPWIFLSHIAAHTKEIALGTGSIITTFQHPINIAKSAVSLDRISNERLLLGLATGDRPIEFDAYKVSREEGEELFRETFKVIRQLWSADEPEVFTQHVAMNKGDLLPKAKLRDIPTFVTGNSGQDFEWIAENGDGWMTYPRAVEMQDIFIRKWRNQTDAFKPFIQSIAIDLAEDPDFKPRQIHLGYRLGVNHLKDYLQQLENIGVDHVMIGSKFSKRPVDEVIQEIGEEVINKQTP